MIDLHKLTLPASAITSCPKNFYTQVKFDLLKNHNFFMGSVTLNQLSTMGLFSHSKLTLIYQNNFPSSSHQHGEIY